MRTTDAAPSACVDVGDAMLVAMGGSVDVDALRFRAAAAGDAPAVVALVTSAYRGDAARAGWTHESDLLGGGRTDVAAVRELIASADSAVMLAELVGDLVACCHIARRRGAGYVGMFAVRPTLQGGGIGARVLAEAERRLVADLGCGEARMTVIDVRAELIAWYERRGWRRTGESEPFPTADARFGVPKRPDLRFAVLAKRLA